MMDLAPWDELSYFSLPTINSFDVSGLTAVQVTSANPMRVGLILNAAAGGTVWFSTDPAVDASGNRGIGLTNQTTPLILIHRHHPGLPQQAWFAVGGMPGVKATVMEITMLRWPDPMEGLSARRRLWSYFRRST
jgi:hypothetical protein